MSSSAALQRAVGTGYGDVFALARAYACRPRWCVGEFAARTGSPHVTFGTRPTLGTWLTIRRA